MMSVEMKKQLVIYYPNIYLKYINIKIPFEKITGVGKMCMARMLEHLDRGFIVDTDIISYIDYKKTKGYDRKKNI